MVTGTGAQVLSPSSPALLSILPCTAHHSSLNYLSFASC